MKLLIITQAVDAKDPILGFFVRWIEEFASHIEHIEVICLTEGTHELPANVHVHSLGKTESSRQKAVGSRIRYSFRFFSLIWKLRNDYDAVFVHMNPEYIVLGGFFWRLWGKHIFLWYMHKSVNLKLRIATFFADEVFTASKESFRLHTHKLHIMGHGIDTDIFSPDSKMLRGKAVLSVGRLSTTKRNDLSIRAAEHFQNDVWIVGEGPERQNLENLASRLHVASRVRFLGPKTQKQLPEIYRTAGVFLHTGENGSLDKVMLEALACGLPVITTNPVFSYLPVTVVAAMPDAIAKEVLTTRQTDARSLARYVREHHSLKKLIPAILNDMQAV